MHYTGTEKVFYNISKMMQQFGHEVKIITFSYYKDSFYDNKYKNILYKDFLYKGIPITAYKFNSTDGIFGNVHDIPTYPNLRHLAVQLLQKEKPDLVHVGHSMRTTEFINATQMLNIPYMMTLTDFWLLCPKAISINSKDELCYGPQNCLECKTKCSQFDFKKLKSRREQAEDILSSAKALITPSQFLADYFKKELPDLKLSVFNHGLDHEIVELNKKEYKDDTAITFFYAGSFQPHKGLLNIVNAFNKIDTKNSKLLIYGSGSNTYAKSVKDAAKNNKNIEFKGIFEANMVGKILNEVDVTIVPSKYFETYCLILHESLSCNVPVICPHIGAMKEKVQNDINGFTYDYGNEKQLANILSSIINKPTQLNRLKQNIKKTIIPTVEQEAKRYLNLYQSITNPNSPKTSKISSSKETFQSSIIIPTKNAGKDFSLLLKNLSNQQEINQSEIIVVDSGSNDETVNIAKHYNAKIIEIDPKDFSHGLTRNLGAKSAIYENLCFLTQDALPESPNWLAKMCKFIKNNNLAATSCSEVAKFNCDLFYKASQSQHQNFLGITHDNDLIIELPKDFDITEIRRKSALNNIAGLYNKTIFEKYKFSQNFGEDVDLAYRLLNNGYKIGLMGSVRVIHSHNRTAHYWLKRHYVDITHLKRIFPGLRTPKVNLQFLISEIVKIYQRIDELTWQLNTQNNQPTAAVIKFIQNHLAILQQPTDFDIVDNNHSIDSDFFAFMQEIQFMIAHNDYEHTQNTIQTQLIGSLTGSFNYILKNYSHMDKHLIEEMKSLLFKAFASSCGYALACAKMSEPKTNQTIINIHHKLMQGV